MKKAFLALIICAFLLQPSWGGGIVTNSNQSAQFARMLARYAIYDVDAAYFNPAGLVKMEDGFYFSLGSQTIMQNKTIDFAHPLLNESTYETDILVPVFPTAFAVYKKNKLAFSLGFGPIGGGGSAEYETGLPSFEIPISKIPGLLTGSGIPTSQYSADINFSGSSVYYGIQAAASYAISDVIAVAAGVRMNIANNTYEGTISNIMINPTYPGLNDGSMTSAPVFFTTLSQALAGTDPMTSAMMAAYAAATSDAEVDVKQTATGITPFFGLNIAPNDKLNLAVKYELATKLEFTNETTTDDVGMYPDGGTFRDDIPAILTAGIGYKITDQLYASAAYTTYFDKNVNRGGREDLIDANMYELIGGMEYMINERIKVSAGYQYGKTGVSDAYQTDLSFSNTSHTFGFGGQYAFTESLSLDLGVMLTSYVDSEITGTDSDLTGFSLPTGYAQKFDKTTNTVAIGLNYKF